MAEESEELRKLRAACEEAFKLFSNSCSHAVTHVIKQYKSSQPYMMANQLVQDLARNPEWREVSIGKLASLVNKGVLIIGGMTGKVHGHVIAVFPGNAIPAGGFDYTNRNGERKHVRRRGAYARAMSTSMGRFPGAKSIGDKTVWDPWANDEEFGKVRFWKYVGASTRPHRQQEEALRYRNPAEELQI